MNVLHGYDLETLRRRLREAERNRRDPWRRNRFWSTQSWNNLFTRLVEAEQQRDLALSEQILSARAAQDDLLAYELAVERYTETEDDCAWYADLLAFQRSTREAWDDQQHLAQSDLNTLAQQQWLIEERHCIHELQRWQYTIETLEQRRRLQKGLETEAWGQTWSAIVNTIADLREFYIAWQAWDRLTALLNSVEQWCNDLLALQQETLERCNRKRGFDRAGLRDDGKQIRLLQAELAQMRSQRLNHIAGAASIADGRVIVAILLLIALVWMLSQWL